MTASPVDMLYGLLTDPQKGIAVTLDDGNTVFTPLLKVPNSGLIMAKPKGQSLIHVEKDPYPQEKEIGLPIPLVVVGPRVGPRSFMPFVGYQFGELQETVEIRVVTRDLDVPYKISGELMRSKLLEDINGIVKANNSNPDGTGTFNWIWVLDPGRDMNEPQGTRLYKSAMAIKVYWIE